jgi:hypothetical protein
MLSTIVSGGATRLRFRLKTEGNGLTDTLIASSGGITIGEWFHAVVTYDGLVMRVYKDGQEVGNAVKSGGGGRISTDPGVGVSIGRNPDGHGEWNGSIDDVRIYNRALTAQEALDLYNVGLNGGICTDNDRDGYGIGDTALCVYPGIDCDDTDSIINPGISEMCDGIDNNCDGIIDEGVTITYYLDGDGDGYGVGEVIQGACALPEGYADNDMDCDDNNAAVYLNAPEICDDVDNQCPGDIGYGDIDENDVCGLLSGLIVYWTFDDGSGSTASDVTSNGNEGTLFGPVWTTGQIDGALEFDGLNDYVDVGPLDIMGNEMTISAWARADSFATPSRDNRLIAKATGTAADNHWWMLSTIVSGGATRLRFRLKTEGNGLTDSLIASSGDITIGEWFHAVVTYDGLVMRVYKDGQEVGNAAKSGGGGRISTDPGVGVSIGRNPDGYGEWNGGIDDVRIYNRALTAHEVFDLYNQ